MKPTNAEAKQGAGDESAFTPGPWHSETPKDESAVCWIFAQTPNLIADVYECKRVGEQRANAQLIATAPELLAALIEALTWTETYERVHGARGTGPLHDSIRKIRAVIAKARGLA